jgi:hypothetical protein
MAKSNQNSLLKNSKSFQNQFADFETPNKQQQTKSSQGDDSTFSTPNQNNISPKSQSFFQLTELLDVDFGMPLNLFNQFNILHPYLSLYYLDYFNAINKMNTKLYCTTALMMSMMKGGGAANGGNNSGIGTNSKSSIASPSPAQTEPLEVASNNESGNFTMSSITSVSPLVAPSSNSSTNLSPNNNNNTNTSQNQAGLLQSSPTQYGYTIGATNILFKQRLYEELDAFIDETEVDLKQNDQLKKQLQLTTADIRFVDYIIKNVNATRLKEQVRVNTSDANNTPTLLSFKKTLPNEVNQSNTNMSGSIDDLTSSSWEGSDDWIRLNFKWYLYSMIGSVIKEDICNQIKLELDSILMHLSNNEAVNDTSSSSSTISLSNEVIDIDDYIEKVNQNSNANASDLDLVSSPNNHETIMEDSQRNGSHKKVNGRRKNSSGSLTSIASNYSSQYTSHMEYREDFNSAFLNEFKKTESFKEWYELNRANLEVSLFKYDKLTQQFNGQTPMSPTTNTSQDNPLANLNNRLQLLYSQLKELDKMRLVHPFNGQISVNDIKLRFNLIFTSTESGRKLNKAFVEGGKLMNSTGKAVNDAFSQAKVSFSSFFNNWSLSSSSQSDSASKSSFKRSSTSNSLSPNEKSTTKM